MAGVLVAHVGGHYVSEEMVREIEEPEFTNTWHPISHGELIDFLEAELPKKGLQILRKQFALAKEGSQMFGMYDLTSDSLHLPDYTISFGLRNSIDKSLAASGCLGSRVFVCDNMAFSGERTFSRKHKATIEEELPVAIAEALDSFLKDFQSVDAALFEHWKTVEVSIGDALESIVDLAESGSLPKLSVYRIRDIFKYPPYPEFKDRTVWSLYNAVSQYAKEEAKNPVTQSLDSMKHFSEFKRRWPTPGMANLVLAS